eukprot:scaffold76922_cov36-Phaeocystis_antarctica.AAC.1
MCVGLEGRARGCPPLPLAGGEMPGPRAAGAPLDGALGAGRDFHRWNVRWNEFSTASARRRESPSLLPQAEAPKKTS